MGADKFGEAGTSSKSVYGKSGKAANGIEMDMDIDLSDSEDDEKFDPNDLSGFTEDFLNNFCKKVATSFFNDYGLISHQISSYNDFVEHGVQKVFDSIREIDVESGYDPSKKGEAEWKFASVKFGKVTLDRPTFWVGEKFQCEEYLKMLPRHARLQNVTYSSRVNVNVTIKNDPWNLSRCGGYCQW